MAWSYAAAQRTGRITTKTRSVSPPDVATERLVPQPDYELSTGLKLGRLQMDNTMDLRAAADKLYEQAQRLDSADERQPFILRALELEIQAELLESIEQEVRRKAAAGKG